MAVRNQPLGPLKDDQLEILDFSLHKHFVHGNHKSRRVLSHQAGVPPFSLPSTSTYASKDKNTFLFPWLPTSTSLSLAFKGLFLYARFPLPVCLPTTVCGDLLVTVSLHKTGIVGFSFLFRDEMAGLVFSLPDPFFFLRSLGSPGPMRD